MPGPGDQPPLAPLAVLEGACWRGTFPDGKTTDTHCYRYFYDGAFLRDTHRVGGDRPEYRGETIYHRDPETGRIVYRYWNSQGGVSDGVVVPEAGRLLFPAERHVTEGGEVIELQTTIEPEGADRYVSVTERRTGEGWEEVWRIEFDRVAPAEMECQPARSRAGQLARVPSPVASPADPVSSGAHGGCVAPTVGGHPRITPA